MFEMKQDDRRPGRHREASFERLGTVRGSNEPARRANDHPSGHLVFRPERPPGRHARSAITECDTALVTNCMNGFRSFDSIGTNRII
jgi:hypothetical protein